MKTDFHHEIQRSATWLLVLIALALGRLIVNATVYTANFDDLSEGFYATSFSDGGLTFSDLDERIPDTPGPYYFTIDGTTAGDLPSSFSPPNVMTTEGYVPGPGVSQGRFGSAWIDFSGVGSSASMDVFASIPPLGLGDYTQNTLSLEAWNGSTMVASVSTTFAQVYTIQESSLVLNNIAPFDRLELVSSGPVDYGVSFIDLDNLSVTAVPEPKGLSLLTVGLVAIICLRRRTKGSSETHLGIMKT